MPASTLYYIADPMCSWCWGFRPVITEILDLLPEEIETRFVMGGLAKDSDEVMSADTQAYVKKQWKLVAERTGAEFNWDFWSRCTPRRSTYPACRAVIAAGEQNPDSLEDMFHAIQKAYYLEARNPSDLDTLIALAEDIHLDVDTFEKAINSEDVDKKLHQDFALRRSLQADKFPSALIDYQGEMFWLAYGYEDPEVVLDTLEAVLVS